MVVHAKDEPYLATSIPKRVRIFEWIQEEQQICLLSPYTDLIKVLLPDGNVKEENKWQTTHLDVAREISKNLANNALIAKVNCVLWDMTRPLEEDSQLQIFRFDDDEGHDTFWHSSSHILGQSHEMEYGCKICIGPCTTRGEGFYSDVFCGDSGLNDDHLKLIEARALKAVAKKHPFKQFAITLVEARECTPGMARKMSQFTSRLFAILMKMLLDIEDDPAWHTAETEDEDAGETSNYSVGQECLDRLSISLGGNLIVPVASEQLLAYLAAPEWQKRLAALIALAQIAEGCSKVMIKNLEQVVAMVLNSSPDQHPHVRWAAINAIGGQLSTDLGLYLQVQYHRGVFPALAAAMDDFQNPRVETHATSALLNFSENCTHDILTPYLDGIVCKLLVLLLNGKHRES
uniref:threonine--tRNA ligase n=1 Tax=Cicer arietinum TaxID=3827 RepID=A0A3Q7XS96_CICAR|nr:importin-5-like [Cicer arietinum]